MLYLLGTLILFIGLAGAFIGMVLIMGLKTMLGAALVFGCLILALLGAHIRG